jgi:hypothetical protein
MCQQQFGRRNCLLGFILAAAFVCGSLLGDEPASVVRLTIDYGDGVQKTFTSLKWKEKMTVFDALKAAKNHPRGIKVSHIGSGAGVFITAIDGVTNEGAGGRNWRYTVNDTPAQVGAGGMELKAGDVIVWRFGK